MMLSWCDTVDIMGLNSVETTLYGAGWARKQDELTVSVPPWSTNPRTEAERGEKEKASTSSHTTRTEFLPSATSQVMKVILFTTKER